MMSIQLWDLGPKKQPQQPHCIMLKQVRLFFYLLGLSFVQAYIAHMGFGDPYKNLPHTTLQAELTRISEYKLTLMIRFKASEAQKTSSRLVLNVFEPLDQGN